MPRLLILLTLPPDVTEQYPARQSQTFPEIADRRRGAPTDKAPASRWPKPTC